MEQKVLRDYVNFHPDRNGLQRFREYVTGTYVMDLTDCVIYMYQTFFRKPLVAHYQAGYRFDETAIGETFINKCANIMRQIVFDSIFIMRPTQMNMSAVASQLASKIAETLIEYQIPHDYNEIDFQAMDAMIVFGNHVTERFSYIMNDPQIKPFYTWLDNPNEPQPVVEVATLGDRVFFSLHKVVREVSPFMGVNIN